MYDIVDKHWPMSQGDGKATRKKRPHPLLRLPGQSHQNRAVEVDLAVRQRAHDEARRQVATQTQMLR